MLKCALPLAIALLVTIASLTQPANAQETGDGGVNVPSVGDVNVPASPPPPDAQPDAPPKPPVEVDPTTHRVTPPAPIEEGEADAPPESPGQSQPVGPLVAPPANGAAPIDDEDAILPPLTIEAPADGSVQAPFRETPSLDPVADPPAPAVPPALSDDGKTIPLWKPGTTMVKAARPSPAEAIAADQKQNVVLLVDRSASMGGNWSWARDDAVTLVRGLDEGQSFHLILFGGDADDVWEIEGDGLEAATLERKIQTIELLTFTSPAGSTDPQAGFRRALDAIGSQPATIHFISDGVFNYPLQVRRDLRSMLAGKNIVVNAHLYGDAYPSAVSAMQAIARDGKGTYVNATQYP